jgi:hypothetical protein
LAVASPVVEASAVAVSVAAVVVATTVTALLSVDWSSLEVDSGVSAAVGAAAGMAVSATDGELILSII